MTARSCEILHGGLTHARAQHTHSFAPLHSCAGTQTHARATANAQQQCLSRSAIELEQDVVAPSAVARLGSAPKEPIDAKRMLAVRTVLHHFRLSAFEHEAGT